MFTACELCVCATYTAVIGTSERATVTPVASTGAFGAGCGVSRPQPAIDAIAAITHDKRAVRVNCMACEAIMANTRRRRQDTHGNSSADAGKASGASAATALYNRSAALSNARGG